MEVDVQGLPARDADCTNGIEPVLHEALILARFDAKAAFYEQGGFWDGIFGAVRDTLIEDTRHEVAMSTRSKRFNASR